jgi:hypothetical protein
MGVLGGSVPGLEGDGTSTSGPCGGVSLGASLGCPGWDGCGVSSGKGGNCCIMISSRKERSART